MALWSRERPSKGGILGPFAEQRLPRQIHRAQQDPDRTNGQTNSVSGSLFVDGISCMFFMCWLTLKISNKSQRTPLSVDPYETSSRKNFGSRGLDLPKAIQLQSIGHCIGVRRPKPSKVCVGLLFINSLGSKISKRSASFHFCFGLYKNPRCGLCTPPSTVPERIPFKCPLEEWFGWGSLDHTKRGRSIYILLEVNITKWSKLICTAPNIAKKLNITSSNC